MIDLRWRNDWKKYNKHINILRMHWEIGSENGVKKFLSVLEFPRPLKQINEGIDGFKAFLRDFSGQSPRNPLKMSDYGVSRDNELRGSENRIKKFSSVPKFPRLLKQINRVLRRF